MDISDDLFCPPDTWGIVATGPRPFFEMVEGFRGRQVDGHDLRAKLNPGFYSLRLNSIVGLICINMIDPMESFP